MTDASYRLLVTAENERLATECAHSLADNLREVRGVRTVDRRKDDAHTMDLGSIVAVAASSAATLAIAQRISDWLRRNRGTMLTIEIHGRATSIKAALEISDPTGASRIKEVEKL